MIDMIGGGVTNRQYELVLPIDNVYLDRHDCREATAVGGDGLKVVTIWL